MTGKWRKPGMPHRGWTCEGIEDLGEPAAVCEMCEVATIRYIHYLTHHDFAEGVALGVGCVCAEKMEQDYVSPRERERTLRNSAARKQRWLTRNWRISSSGNDYLNTDGMNIVVFQRSNGIWSFRITDKYSEKQKFSPRTYKSEDAAKLNAFDEMIFLKTQGRGDN